MVWFFSFGFGFFETGSLYKVLAILELTRLTLNSLRSACLCLVSTGMKGVYHIMLGDFFLSMRNEILVSHPQKEYSSFSNIPSERLKTKC